MSSLLQSETPLLRWMSSSAPLPLLGGGSGGGSGVGGGWAAGRRCCGSIFFGGSSPSFSSAGRLCPLPTSLRGRPGVCSSHTAYSEIPEVCVLFGSRNSRFFIFSDHSLTILHAMYLVSNKVASNQAKIIVFLHISYNYLLTYMPSIIAKK